MQYVALTYNTFALPTLMYVGQLERPPPMHACLEKRGLINMLPGPGQWITPSDACYLKEEFGQNRSFAPMADSMYSAQLRVAEYGCRPGSESKEAGRGSNKVATMAGKLRACMADSEFLNRRLIWKEWYSSSHYLVLEDNLKRFRSLGITPQGLNRQLAGDQEPPWDSDTTKKQKRLFQKTALANIKRAHTPNAVERIRRKVERWRGKPYALYGQPGRYSVVIHKRLQMLSTLLTPRVNAAVFKTIWNGWCVPRRFQKRHSAADHCLLGCDGDAQDCIEHYCRCPAVTEVGDRFLRVRASPPRALNLWLLNEIVLEDPRVMRSVALLMYGTYMTTNYCRHNGRYSRGAAIDSIKQHCMQGARGNADLESHLDGCWLIPTTSIS